MKANLRSILAISCLTAAMCVGCGTASKEETSEVEVKTNAIQSEIGDEIGVNLELTDRYAECEFVKMTQAELDSVMPNCAGGFKLTKAINGTTYTVSEVIITKIDNFNESGLSHNFPFSMQGSEYILAASMPVINTTSEDYAEILNLQNNGLMEQLSNIYFDEQVLISGGTFDEAVDIENDDSNDNTGTELEIK